MSLQNSLFSTLFPSLAPTDAPPTLAPVADDYGNSVPVSSGAIPIPPPTADPMAVEQLSQIGDAAAQGQRYGGDDSPQVDPYAIQDLANIAQSASKGQRAATPTPRKLGEDAEQGGSLTRATRTPVAMPSIVDAPTTLSDKDAKKAGKPSWEFRHPDFAMPFPQHNDGSPLSGFEQAQNALAMTQYKAQHPEDEDHGVKGRILELLQNFGVGLAQTPRDASVGQALLLGAAGAGTGLVNRKWNEERAAQEALPQLEQNVKIAGQAANVQNEMQNRNLQTQIDISKSTQAAIKADQAQYIDQWKDLASFDPVNNPDNKAFAAEAAKHGVHLTSKTPTGKFSITIAPNGDVVTANTLTGEHKTDHEGLSKPPTITANELPDTLFGLSSEKDISDRATASIDQLPKDRQLDPTVSSALMAKTKADGSHPYQNADGSFNESKYWQDLAGENVNITPTQLYKNLPSDVAQREASSRVALRNQEKSRRVAVDEFRTAISNHAPASDAKPVPINTIVNGFKDVLDKAQTIKDKEKRKAFIQRYYTEVLPHIKVGG